MFATEFYYVPYMEGSIVLCSTDHYLHHRIYFTVAQSPVQGFAESLQQDSSNQSEIVMIKLYCCGPDYCSRYPLLYYFFQIRNGLGSSVFKLCCKDSAKPCTCMFLHRPQNQKQNHNLDHNYEEVKNGPEEVKNG